MHIRGIESVNDKVQNNEDAVQHTHIRQDTQNDSVIQNQQSLLHTYEDDNEQSRHELSSAMQEQQVHAFQSGEAIINNSSIDNTITNSELFHKKRVVGKGKGSAYSPTKIAVIGVGGGGVNAVSSMISLRLKDIDLWVANTDAQTLSDCPVQNVMLLGANSCKGLGVGGNPLRGAEAVYEIESELVNVLENYDMVFLATGLGGGTGSGAIPVLAKIARERGVLVVAVVTMPFYYEGQNRLRNAENSLEELEDFADALIIVPNDSLVSSSKMRSDVFVEESFHTVNKILSDTVTSITNILTNRGTVNIDFADIKSCIQNSGLISVGLGESNIEDNQGGNAHKAVEMALTNKLLSAENAQVLSYADNIIVNVVMGKNCPMQDYAAITDLITSRTAASPANIKTGHRFEPTWDHRVQVTVIAASSLKCTGKKLQEKEQNTDTTYAQRNYQQTIEKDTHVFPKYSERKEDNDVPTSHRSAFKQKNVLGDTQGNGPVPSQETGDRSLHVMYGKSTENEKYVDSDVFLSLVNQPTGDVNDLLQKELDDMDATSPLQKYSEFIPK